MHFLNFQPELVWPKCYGATNLAKREMKVNTNWIMLNAPVPWRRNHIETFSALVDLCEGNHRSPVDSPTKASDAEYWCFIDLCQNKSGANNRNAGDLRPHRTHYDVTVMHPDVDHSTTQNIAVHNYLSTSSFHTLFHDQYPMIFLYFSIPNGWLDAKET